MENWNTTPDKFIFNKVYNISVTFIPKPRQKLSKLRLPLKDVLIKGSSARGIRIANQDVKKVN